jgi:hypothetical protein
MRKTERYRWQFAQRFRRNAFGWRSQPALQRVQEAVSEIRRIRRKDAVLAAEGAVLFLEKLSPALEQVDSSSGAIGTAVNRAIEQLVAVIARAPVEKSQRAAWLERLWEAYTAESIPYIETLGDFWGDLCAGQELASAWADKLICVLQESWEQRHARKSYFPGTPVCLSSLLAAGRYQELLDLLEKAPLVWWEYRRWGVRALLATDRADAALRYAESSREPNENPAPIARACEEILLSLGRRAEAYEQFAIVANRGTSYVAAFRAIARKYPEREPAKILHDLVADSPGEEGKWFAAAKEAGLLQMAAELANQSPCDPSTLTRAARDFIDKDPVFALEAGLAALRWLGEGYGYEVNGADVWAAYTHTMNAAERVGRREVVRERIRTLVANKRFMTELLGRELGLSGKETPSAGKLRRNQD